MAKEGLSIVTISVDDSGGTARDLSNDILSATLTTPQGQFDMTGLDKSAIERLGGLMDAKLSLHMTFNDAAGASFQVFKNPSVNVGGAAGRTVSYAVSGQTLPMEMLITSVSYPRGADGVQYIDAELELCSGTVPTWA